MKIFKRRKCEKCTGSTLQPFTRLGLRTDKFDYIVALAGNPNTGKSTVFNRLTGLHQHTGNWPGKTVTRAEGGFSYQDKNYKLIDLPGTYSLLSNTTDEEIARNYILFGQPDVTVIVVDASRLERNLNLVLQILEITDRAVVCLNLLDEANRHQIGIDENQLAGDLGVPVVPTVARSGKGMSGLLRAISDVAHGCVHPAPHRIQIESREVNEAVNKLVEKLNAAYPGIPNTRWIALRLLEGDESIIEAVRNDALFDIIKDQIAVPKALAG